MTDQDSDRSFRLLADHSSDYIARVDRELRYVYLNAGAARLLDRAPADVLGKTNRELGILEPRVTLSEEHLRAAFRTGQPEEFDGSFSTVDGVRFVSTRYQPECAEDGTVETVLVIAHDVTERGRAQDAFKFLVQCGSTASGEDFFQSLARYLARSLGMDYVCIDRLRGDLLAAQTVAIYFDGRFEDNVSYTLKDTPCGDVVGRTVCCFPKDVRHLFPTDIVLQDMVAESYVGTTLWGSQGQPVGLIAVIGRHPLEDPRLATSLLQLVAVRAAGELERRQAEEALAAANTDLRQVNESLDARVHARTADLERRTTQLRALAMELTWAEERERRRAARLIHDELQQFLVVARITIDLASRQIESALVKDDLKQVDDLIGQSLAVARSLTAELSPAVLYRSGLPTALSWLGQWYQDKHGLSVAVSAAADADVDSEELRVTLFRAARELLFNVTKHAQVKNASVSLERDGRFLQMFVADEGVGFDPAATRANEGSAGGFGLFSLRERLEALGGGLVVWSAPSEGTRVALRVPVPTWTAASQPTTEPV